MSYVVTGGCGFIGSNFVNYLCKYDDKDVFVIDKMTYAASESNIDLKHFRSGQARLYKCDLAVGCDALDKILEHSKVDGVFHFAAESHVDKSIDGPRVFVERIDGPIPRPSLMCAIRHFAISPAVELMSPAYEIYGEIAG